MYFYHMYHMYHCSDMIKFIYSEKATKFWEISTLDLSYVVPVKPTVEISQNFVVFSEYMNFTKNVSHNNRWNLYSTYIFFMMKSIGRIWDRRQSRISELKNTLQLQFGCNFDTKVKYIPIQFIELQKSELNWINWIWVGSIIGKSWFRIFFKFISSRYIRVLEMLTIFFLWTHELFLYALLQKIWCLFSILT